MNTQTAYRTADPEVIAAYDKWYADSEAVMDKRRALSESLGRQLWVNKGSGYGSTRVVAFERFDSDNDGDLIYFNGNACLIVSSKRGHHDGRVVPNLRRKAGKDFERELASEYTTPKLDLPGMATFHVYATNAGLVMGGPGLFVWEGVAYAFWECDDAPVKDNWESIPLSTYHLAREQKEQADA